MKSYIIVYDLHKEGQNYDCLHEKLKKYTVNWHIQRSVWIVATDQKSKQIRDNLKSCLDSNDKLFVGKLNGEAAWHGYSQKVTDWLKKYL